MTSNVKQEVCLMQIIVCCNFTLILIDLDTLNSL